MKRKETTWGSGLVHEETTVRTLDHCAAGAGSTGCPAFRPHTHGRVSPQSNVLQASYDFKIYPPSCLTTNRQNCESRMSSTQARMLALDMTTSVPGASAGSFRCRSRNLTIV